MAVSRIRKEELGQITDIRHKEEQGIPGSEAKSQSKGAGMGNKGTKGWSLGADATDTAKMPKASDSRFEPKLGPGRTTVNKANHGQKKGWNL